MRVNPSGGLLPRVLPVFFAAAPRAACHHKFGFAYHEFNTRLAGRALSAGGVLSRRKKNTDKPLTPTTSSAATASSLHRLEWLIPVVLLLAGTIAYSNSFSGPFIFDDLSSIRDNSHIRHLWPLSAAMSSPPRTTVTGRPVVSLSLALNFAGGGLNVWGYHAFNLAFHLLAALTLFGVLRRTLAARPGCADPTAAAWLSGAVALIWELHPLATDAVDYVVQRTELLASLFLLLVLYCVARGASSRHPWRWYGAGIAACGLGMGSKEIMVGAPVIAVLYDGVFLSPSWRDVWRRRRYFHAGLATTWVILLAELASGGAHSETIGFGFRGAGPLEYLKTQCGVLLYYLRLSVWPSPLSIDYADWPVTRTPLLATPAFAVMVVLGALTIWALFRKPWLGFPAALFFIILAPTSSFVPIVTEFAAERRMYLALAAVVSIAVMGVYTLLRRIWNKPPSSALAPALGLAAVFALMTYQRNEDFRSDMSIWSDVLEKRPNNPRALNNVGLDLGNEGRVDEAMALFTKALTLDPGFTDALSNMGAMFEKKGRLEDAVSYYRKAVSLQPEHMNAQHNLALALHRLGLLDEAEQRYLQVLKLNPDYVAAHNNYASLLLTRGRVAEAIAHLKEVVRLDPAFPNGQENLLKVEQSVH